MKRSTIEASFAVISVVAIIVFVYVHESYLMPNRLLAASEREYDGVGNSRNPLAREVGFSKVRQSGIPNSPGDAFNQDRGKADGAETARRLLRDKNGDASGPSSKASSETETGKVGEIGFSNLAVSDLMSLRGRGRAQGAKQRAASHSVRESSHSPSSTAKESAVKTARAAKDTDASILHEYAKSTEEAEKGSNKTLAEISPNHDVIARGKFQQLRVEYFCRHTGQPSTFPDTAFDQRTLFRHLLYDDSKRLVICYVPKNGCSNVKHMMLILQGQLPPSSVDTRPSEATLRNVSSLLSLDQEEIDYRLKHYYKMVIVREPMERLVSAYRNKVRPPLNYTNMNNEFDAIKGEILRQYRLKEFQEYETLLEQGRTPKEPMWVTFREFSLYMTSKTFSSYNEHFQPVLELCRPCAVNYDFYATFTALNHDMHTVMDHLNIPSSYYPSRVSHPNHPTEEYVSEYLRELPESDRKKLLTTFRDEIEFYNTVYPENKGVGLEL